MTEKVTYLFEDKNYYAIDKPAPLLMHPTKLYKDHLIPLSEQLLTPVHFLNRLDRQASGIVLVAKSAQAATKLQRIWHTEHVEKLYTALVKGAPQAQVIERPMRKDNGQICTSWSRIKLLQTFKNASLVEVQIKTGLRHQIRRHMNGIFSPIIGDRVHGKGPINNEFLKLGLKRLFLHHHQLSFKHPYTDEQIQIDSCLPLELKDVLSRLYEKN